MKKAEIKELFSEAFYEIAPENCVYGQAGKFFYARWEATLMNRLFYGLAVRDDKGSRTDLAQIFDTRHGADLYIKNLGEK